MDNELFIVFFVFFILVFFLTCAELYSMRKSVERMSDETRILKEWAVGKIKDREYLIDELREKEDECFRLRKQVDELYKKQGAASEATPL